jgi:hypothetical protein
MRTRASTYAYLTIFWMITSAVMKPQHIVKKVSHVRCMDNISYQFQRTYSKNIFFLKLGPRQKNVVLAVSSLKLVECNIQEKI